VSDLNEEIYGTIEACAIDRLKAGIPTFTWILLCSSAPGGRGSLRIESG